MTRVSRGLTWLPGIWVLLLLATEYLVAERHPIAALITYMPQHPLALPLLPGLVTTVFTGRWRLALVNCIFAVSFVVFLMGFNLGLPANGRGDLKVITINVERSGGETQQLLELVRREEPDVVFLQEAVPLSGKHDVVESLTSLGDELHVARSADVAIVSRYPLTSVREAALLTGSTRRMLAADIDIDGKPFTLACVHFATNIPAAPRRDLVEYLRGSAESRMQQTRTMLEQLPSESIVIAGDFNLPPRGLAYRRITRRYKDAFRAGSGFGYTYRSGMPVMRIDHVFVSRDIKPTMWRTVDSGASDHLAIIAEIVLLP